jgi:hypothetical protein
VKGALMMAGYSVQRPLYANVLHELECAMQQPGVTDHHIAISDFQNIQLGDFTKTEAMIKEGQCIARKYLAQPQPNRIHYPRRYTAHSLPPGPPGSRPFIEPLRSQTS